MTDVRTFKADNMQQALDLVRQEMGSDAVILHTRQITPRRFLPWTKVKSEVEVTAGRGMNVGQQSSRRRQRRQKAMQASAIATRTRVESNAKPAPVSSSTVTLAEYINNRDAQVESNSMLDSLVRMADQLDTVSFSSSAKMSQPAAPIPSETRTMPQVMVARVPERPAPARPVASNRSAELAAKLDNIQRMLENLSRTGHIGHEQEIPSELFTLYTELIDAETEDEVARNLISRLKRECSPEQLKDWRVAKSLLTGMVESEIRCSGPIKSTPGRRKVVALVGATGVGKTTTIAKLAANFRLRQGIKMGLVTVDTYRIAAVEQLRTYAEIIDLPMKVVTNALEMRRALDELVGLDLVLVDTAGRSPRDELQIQELKRLLAEADIDEVHLVMNMTNSVKSLEATVEKFREASANMTSIILTKLDEAAGMGTLLSIARRISLPVSYITTGQDVPDDIESATPGRIARLILGQDKLSN